MDEKRGKILDHAIALADERGLGAISMRSVAERLGLSSMAIYPYVGNKEALLDGMVDRLLAELAPVASSGGPWQARLRAVAHAVRALARRHPGAYQLIMDRPSDTPDARRLDEILLGVLREAGVPEGEVPRLERLLSTLVLGLAASEVNGRFTVGADRPADVDWDAEFDADLDDGIRLVEQLSERGPGRPTTGDLTHGRA